MRRLIQWTINNTPAMNMAMISILIVGMLCAFMLRREEFPKFDLEIIYVTVPYPGASPDEIETGICQKIEESIRSIEDIKKVVSIAQEGAGSVVIELNADVKDVQKILGEVESAVDRIPSFPKLAERPEVQQVTLRGPAIKVGVIADESINDPSGIMLRNVTEGIRSDLLGLGSISVANIQGERDYQIDIEISENTLKKYGLSLKTVADRVREQNLELPAGTIKGKGENFLVRGKDKRVWGEEIEKIPLITTESGTVLTVADLGEVRDEFIDTTSISSINGKQGLAISVEAAEREDMLEMTEAVREYVEGKQNSGTMPYGYSLEIWEDHSIEVRDRLRILQENGIQGLVLVFLVLALFLQLRLSFWVALGIPVSVFGSCIVLFQMDQTLNMLSMFSFLIALGIVVDDAIVVGENIYAHHEQGKPFRQAAIDGTVEVIPSVTTSVTTTIMAFIPMMFVTGVMGKFFAVIPLAVIAILAISLLECIFILPCHLSHEPHAGPKRSWTTQCYLWYRGLSNPLVRGTVGTLLLLLVFLLDCLIFPFKLIGKILVWTNEHFSTFLDRVIYDWYTPLLKASIRHPQITCALAVSGFMLSLIIVMNGTVPRVVFPELDAKAIKATVVFPDGTPSRITDAATKKIDQAIRDLNQEYEAKGETLVKVVHRMVGQVTAESFGGNEDRASGSHAGAVSVQLVDNQDRSVSSMVVIDQWREAVGEIAGADEVTFKSVSGGPGGAPIEFKLLAPAEHMQELESAVEKSKEKLKSYTGVYDIRDDSRPGKWEQQLSIDENSRTMGVTLQELAQDVRAAYYGEEVMRLQRGRHEVKLMVRYPREERRTLTGLADLEVDTPDGVKRPLSELAKIEVKRGYSEINRLNQMRSITITTAINEGEAVASEVITDLQKEFLPNLLEEHPHVRIRWEGQKEQDDESMVSLGFGLMVALLAMYVLLTLEFKSYLQPAIIMSVIPFGFVGALWGHAFMGIPLSMISMFGLVALTGIVVNDSIVLIDFINHRIKDGMPLADVLVESGQRRFRPVLLTSLTTIAGLSPILTETSMQAQILVPMANSICFGVLFATVLVLFLVPTFYVMYAGFLNWIGLKLPAEKEYL